jgi:hypothetical protein
MKEAENFATSTTQFTSNNITSSDNEVRTFTCLWSGFHFQYKEWLFLSYKASSPALDFM